MEGITDSGPMVVVYDMQNPNLTDRRTGVLFTPVTLHMTNDNPDPAVRAKYPQKSIIVGKALVDAEVADQFYSKDATRYLIADPTGKLDNQAAFEAAQERHKKLAAAAGSMDGFAAEVAKAEGLGTAGDLPRVEDQPFTAKGPADDEEEEEEEEETPPPAPAKKRVRKRAKATKKKAAKKR